MRFSVVVPVYRTEEYIRECVDSILNQTYKDFELILVDDGSPDRCPEICDQYVALDNRIRVIHKPNGGLSEARNFGIQAAKGDYLVFVDSDDALMPDALEHIALCTANDPDVVITELYNTTDMRLDCIAQKDLFTLPQAEDVHSMIAFVFQKKEHTWASVQYILRRQMVIDHHLKYDVGYYHEDMSWTPRLFIYAKCIAFYNQIWYVRRLNRDGSITNTASYRKIKDALTLIVNEIHSDAYSVLPREDMEIVFCSLVGSIFSTLNRCSCCSETEIKLLADYMDKNFDVFRYARKIKHRVFVTFAKLFGVEKTLRICISYRRHK